MKRVLALSATLALVCATAAAHHGWSGYNEDALELSGTIEESSYQNPHGLATLKTADKTWKVVLAPVSRMEARGLTRDMLKPGTQVSVISTRPMRASFGPSASPSRGKPSS
jgi:hypothetical protein